MALRFACHCEERSDVAIRDIVFVTDSHASYAGSE